MTQRLALLIAALLVGVCSSVRAAHAAGVYEALKDRYYKAVTQGRHPALVSKPHSP